MERGIGCERKCICLDCGKSINEKDCQNLFNIDSKNYYHMETIRKDYLELLYLTNTEDSINILSEDCGIKLSLVNHR